MRPSTLQRLFLFGMLALASACARGSARSSAAFAASPEDGRRAMWCRERPVLVLENFSGGKVEVIERRVDGAIPIVIATRSAGTHTIPIRGETGYSYNWRPAPETTLMNGTDRQVVPIGEVEIRRECRPRDG